MSFATILFYLFSSILLRAAVSVIFAKNTVHAVLSLILCFFSAAALWLLLKAEFLAIVLVLVYVGAVMVLFLFVVMMLDVQMKSVSTAFLRHLPLAFLVGGLIVLEMVGVIVHGFWKPDYPVLASSASLGMTKPLGMLIYTEYIYAFEIAAVILLVAIVAALALTLHRRKDRKMVNLAAAVRTRREDRIRLVQEISQ